ncbi:hypothetical protein BGZ94_004429 [Podila epigama]|nr:hypothetical protein BGZ94_004429 [Podila epigama]
MSFLRSATAHTKPTEVIRTVLRPYSTKPPPSTLPANKQRFIPTSGQYPRGFLVSGISSSVKKSGAKDLALITSKYPCSAAAVFTKNVFQAAPVVVSRERLQDNGGKAIHGLVTNSGCANAVTGTKGLENAKEMQATLDALTGHARSSLVMSTESKQHLGTDHEHWMACAQAYMTTDTFPKLRSKTFSLPESKIEYRMAGITKGAGMIHPDMATLLGTIVTDLGVEPGLLQYALTHAVDRSFNAISGAPTFEAAKTVASTIATSSLVKTALYGQDANWGRILCAVGYSGVQGIDPKKVSVSFVPMDKSEPLKLLVNGEPEQVNEERASEILKMEDLEIRVELNVGQEATSYWTCDLSHEYISINADYRS